MFDFLLLKRVPWWIRLLILIGLPILMGWFAGIAIENTEELLHAEPEMASIFTWMIYACFVWGIVFLNAGGKKLLEYLAMAFILGLTILILGVIMRKLLPILAGNLSGVEITFMMIRKFFMIIMALPYSMLVINSFSAKNLIARIIKKKGKFKTIGLHFALAIRVFQHTGEVIFNLLEIWTEEHPEKLLPRHRRSWGIKLYSKTNVFPWIVEAISAWIFACIIQTIAPILVMANEVEKINKLS